MDVTRYHTIEELEQLAAAERHAARHLKLRAIVLAKRRWEAVQIAEALGKSRRTIQQWVHDYNHGSLDGLIDRRGGNRRYLDAEQEQRLRDHLDRMGEDPEDGPRHAAELLPWIEEHFGVAYSLSGLYDLLHRLGYAWLMPRPRHPKHDPAAQAAFKKRCRTGRIDPVPAPRQTHRGLVPGRSPLRPTRYAHPQVGTQGLTPARGQTDPVRLPLRAGGGVPGHGADRRPARAVDQHRRGPAFCVR